MIKGSAAKEESKWDELWEFTKSYVTHVGQTYLSFVFPMLLLVAVNVAVDVDDKERFGLGWMRLTSLKDDRAREEKYPAYEPSSAAQRRRTEAAKAVDYAVDNV